MKHRSRDNQPFPSSSSSSPPPPPLSPPIQTNRNLHQRFEIILLAASTPPFIHGFSPSIFEGGRERRNKKDAWRGKGAECIVTKVSITRQRAFIMACDAKHTDFR